MVSLTTYGMRSRTVHLAVESIARGKVKPSRLILWIDEPELLQHPTPHLRRLQHRGLEIRLTANVGPHKKYYPYVCSEPHHLTALVTADDDALYPAYWLAELTDAHRAQPDQIHCFRARVIAFAAAELRPYLRWAPCATTTPSVLNFAIGVSGVLYPAPMLDSLRLYGDAFLEHTFYADDVWLHWVAMQSGIAIRQVRATPITFPSIPGTQAIALLNENLNQGRNDHIVRATYSRDDLTLLRSIQAPHEA